MLKTVVLAILVLALVAVVILVVGVMVLAHQMLQPTSESMRTGLLTVLLTR
jgi:hypothetical protein